MIRNLRILVIFWSLTLLFLLAPGNVRAESWLRAFPWFRSTESSADLAFIKGKYDKAMRSYEQVYNRLDEQDERKNVLALKIARFYMLLQQNERAVDYFDRVFYAADTLMGVGDVCYYIDALRGRDENQRAEVIARHFAFMQPFSRNQRYLNTLFSLANQQHYYRRGDAEYEVRLFEGCGPEAEYWMGEWNGKPFYAVSHGMIQDPQKIYYHRTQFYSMRSQRPEIFRDIPRELQSGPVAFSDDGKIMVATKIIYRNKGRILKPGVDKSVFINQLYYSVFDTLRGGWSDFIPLFNYQEGVSYAHPVFFNAGKSLMFSSDRPGGYGGMDLYMCHWDEERQQWGEPVNMGPEINTEGDEVYPRIVGDALFFSSNGWEGFGGYDIYRVSFGHNIVMSGTLYHYPWPVNTVFNDFGMFFDGETGYFVSDRRGAAGKDDIYTFNAASTPLSSKAAVGVSDEYSAMVGNLNLVKGLLKTHTSSIEKEVKETPVYMLPESGQLLTSIYFEFDSYRILPQAKERLFQILAMRGFDDITEISVIGYADELGTPEYNMRLSEQRANAVVQFFKAERARPRFFPEGRGQLHIPLEDYVSPASYLSLDNKEVQPPRKPLTRKERIVAYQKARRVDIIVKKKQ